MQLSICAVLDVIFLADVTLMAPDPSSAEASPISDYIT